MALRRDDWPTPASPGARSPLGIRHRGRFDYVDGELADGEHVNLTAPRRFRQHQRLHPQSVPGGADFADSDAMGMGYLADSAYRVLRQKPAGKIHFC